MRDENAGYIGKNSLHCTVLFNKLAQLRNSKPLAAINRVSFLVICAVSFSDFLPEMMATTYVSSSRTDEASG